MHIKDLIGKPILRCKPAVYPDGTKDYSYTTGRPFIFQSSDITETHIRIGEGFFLLLSEWGDDWVEIG